MAGATNYWGSALADQLTGQPGADPAFPSTLELRLGKNATEAGAFTELTMTGYSAVSIDVTSPGLTFDGASAGLAQLASGVDLEFGTNNSGSDVAFSEWNECALWDTTSDEALLIGTVVFPAGSPWLQNYTLVISSASLDLNAN